jgi:hypothetical protein
VNLIQFSVHFVQRCCFLMMKVKTKMKTCDWTYKGQSFTEEHVGDNFGFVYEIVNTSNQRRYIGKKFFTKSGRKQIKGKTKKVRLSSGWENYWSSSEELQSDVKTFGEENFTRTILYLCKTRSECSYRETKEIFLRDALLTETYYNKWVSVRINARNLNSLRD